MPKKLALLLAIAGIASSAPAGVLSLDANITGAATGIAAQDNTLGVMQVYTAKSSGRLARVDVRAVAEPGKGYFLYGFHALDGAGNVLPESVFSVGGGVTAQRVDDAAGNWLSIEVNRDRRVVAGQRYGLLFCGGERVAFGTTDAAAGLSLWNMQQPVGPVQPEAGRSLLYRVVLEIDNTPGDANQDGRVDLSDFGTLKASFGSEGSWADGDFTGDGRIDLSDFGAMKESFGSPAAAVPEPSTVALALIALAAIAWRCR